MANSRAEQFAIEARRKLATMEAQQSQFTALIAEREAAGDHDEAAHWRGHLAALEREMARIKPEAYPAWYAAHHERKAAWQRANRAAQKVEKASKGA